MEKTRTLKMLTSLWALCMLVVLSFCFIGCGESVNDNDKNYEGSSYSSVINISEVEDISSSLSGTYRIYSATNIVNTTPRAYTYYKYTTNRYTNNAHDPMTNLDDVLCYYFICKLAFDGKKYDEITLRSAVSVIGTKIVINGTTGYHGNFSEIYLPWTVDELGYIVINEDGSSDTYLGKQDIIIRVDWSYLVDDDSEIHSVTILD